MSTKRMSAGESHLPTMPSPSVRRSKRGRIESVVSESLEGFAPDVRKISPLKGRQVTFDPSVKTITLGEIRQIHTDIRHAIDRGMPELIEAIRQIPQSCTPKLLNQNSHESTFPIFHAINKLKNHFIPIETFIALFDAGYRLTNLHLFFLWDTLDGKHPAPSSERDLSFEKQALTGLFLKRMPKNEVIKTMQIFWSVIFEIQRRQFPDGHPKILSTQSAFEFLIEYTLVKGFENFCEYLVLGFKEIAPSDLEQISKIHDFDKKLLDILFRTLHLALERGAPLSSLRTLVDIICVIDMANPVYSASLGQTLLRKYLKTSINLEVLRVILRIHIQIDPKLLEETIKGCTPEVQALLKEKLMITG